MGRQIQLRTPHSLADSLAWLQAAELGPKGVWCVRVCGPSPAPLECPAAPLDWTGQGEEKGPKRSLFLAPFPFFFFCQPRQESLWRGTCLRPRTAKQPQEVSNNPTILQIGFHARPNQTSINPICHLGTLAAHTLWRACESKQSPSKVEKILANKSDKIICISSLLYTVSSLVPLSLGPPPSFSSSAWPTFGPPLPRAIGPNWPLPATRKRTTVRT